MNVVFSIFSFCAFYADATDVKMKGFLVRMSLRRYTKNPRFYFLIEAIWISWYKALNKAVLKKYHQCGKNHSCIKPERNSEILP